jgi:hypothetical protein
MDETLTLVPTKHARQFRTPEGKILEAPSDWDCLPPGDAGLTRRLKSLGPSWTISEKRGRKVFSRGVWAPALNIATAKAQVEAERADPSYTKRLVAAAKRRDKQQEEYVDEFADAVLAFLNFEPTHAELAKKIATAVAAHATPVGSGTVARTKRISVDERAEAAVIAWMRHQTTAYDQLKIARVKGERRRVRRELAEISRKWLDLHRGRGEHSVQNCPLCRVFACQEEKRP